jgi:CheY-like chemotaxis protein
MEKGKAYNIAIAEDDPNDLFFMQKVIQELNPDHKVISLYTGQQLLNYLQHKGNFFLEPLPDVIFLDLNMPVLNGFSALKEIKEDGFLKKIPVYVFSGTTPKPEIKETLSSWIAGYFVKPDSLEELKGIVSKILKDLSK